MTLAPLKNKWVILMLDTSMHTSLCQDWFSTCHQSSRMSPLTFFLVKMKKKSFFQYITRYGVYTRANPYCKLHGAYTKYTKIHNISYINNCDGWNKIISVTMFLVTLFNACFMYQTNPCNNLLFIALTGFDYGKSFTDDTFMNTLIKFYTHIKLFKTRIICILMITQMHCPFTSMMLGLFQQLPLQDDLLGKEHQIEDKAYYSMNSCSPGQDMNWSRSSLLLDYNLPR